jgi:hypothetical protein
MALRLLVLALVPGGLSSPQNPTRPVAPADTPVYQEGSVEVQATPAARRAGSPDLTALREIVGTRIVREAILRPPR